MTAFFHKILLFDSLMFTLYRSGLDFYSCCNIVFFPHRRERTLLNNSVLPMTKMVENGCTTRALDKAKKLDIKTTILSSL